MSSGPSRRSWTQATPVLFVLLWSTGFIGAKLGLPHAEPFTFLGVRMLIAAGLLLVVAALTSAPWPTGWRGVIHIAGAGLLVHAAYLGGVFSSIHLGVPAGIASLIVGLQPLLTAALAGWMLGEQVVARQWMGLVLGLAGVVLVVWSKVETIGMSWQGVGAALLALLGITVGTLYQKRFCTQMDLRTGGVIQYATTAVAMFALALCFESMHIDWTGEFVFALGWLVLVLSVGAVGLLYTLIHYGAAAKVASLFYLTPPITACFAFILFGEQLGILAIFGMIVAMIGVALVNVSPRSRTP